MEDRPAASDAVGAFVAVMRQLRAECPWKAEQTHRSLARYLLEETHETLEAIDVGNETGDWAHLREELGDLLLQVVFHAVIAEEAGQFDLADVAEAITAKMHRRNPHVFGEAAGSSPSSGDPGTSERTSSPSSGERGTSQRTSSPSSGERGTSQRTSSSSSGERGTSEPRIETPLDAAAVTELWEQAKAAEKERSSVAEGLPPTLPALLYADKVLDRLAREGHAITVEDSDDLGDRLLALVAEAQTAGVDPEQSLRDAVRRLL